MYKNHLKIAVRSLTKRKGFAVINIVGLALGIWCSLMIALWVQDEFGWDNFHENGERLSQVMANVNGENGKFDTWDGIGYPVGTALSEHIPEINELVRTGGPRTSVVRLGEKVMETQIMAADPNFFQLFSFPLKEGISESCLEGIKNIVLSEELANSYFPDESAIGKSVMITLDEVAEPYLVTGVFEKIPQKSTLQFGAVVPLDNFLAMTNESWGNGWTKTYAVIDQNVSLEQINAKIKNVPKTWGDSEWFTLFLQPLKDRYLYAKFENGQVVGGRIDYVRLFLIIAAFTLLIACFNFINLTTAWAIKRSKEVGIKKVMGAGKGLLIVQFFIESVLLVCIALVIALLFAKLSMPFFNDIASKQLFIDFTDPTFYILLAAITLVTAFFSGIYPAFFLSSFSPITALKGIQKGSFGQAILRKSLVTVQFCLCMIMVAGIIVVYLQLEYVQNKNLGLDKENIVYVPMDLESYPHSKTMLAEIEKIADIKVVSSASGDFSSMGGNTSDPTWEGRDDTTSKPWFSILDVNFGLLEMLDIRLKKGRLFDQEFASDTLNYVINEEAAKAMGMKDPIGKKLSFWGEEGGKIVGVVKNFHFNSLHNPITPMIIRCRPTYTEYFYVKTRQGKTKEILAHLKKVHQQFSSLPFAYHFLDQAIEQAYAEEQKVQKLGGIFALLAIFISCLGLFGLAAFAANQRIKEIAIRKVLGANVLTLFGMLTNDFLKIIFLSSLIAIPISWYLMNRWVQGFAFHIEIQWWMYGLAGSAILLIALLTISSQTLKVANKNPIKSLRTE